MTGSRAAAPPRRTPRWAVAGAALAIVAACYAVFVVFLAIVARVPTSVFDTGRPIDELPFMTGSLVAGMAGAVLAARRPRNPVGWLLLSFAFGFCAYPTLVLVTHWLGLDATSPLWLRLVAWPGNWVWLVSHASLIFLLLLVPDGRLPSPRWRPVAWVAIADLGTLWILVALHDRLELAPDAPNPFGVVAFPDAAVAPFVAVMLGLEALAAVSLVVRYRGSRAVTRSQLKWVALGGAVTMLLTLLLSLGTATGIIPPGAAWARWAEGFTGLPLLGGLTGAVLRYRLFEIDRVISRTATYAVVTAILLAVYTTVAVLPSVLLDVESDLLVAAATLAAAGASVPVRRRVTDFVDRRFDRARYDATRVAERFGARLRDELEVQALMASLRDVVATTVAPASLSVWLRDAGPRR